MIDDNDENIFEEKLDGENKNEGESGIGTNEIMKVFFYQECVICLEHPDLYAFHQCVRQGFNESCYRSLVLKQKCVICRSKMIFLFIKKLISFSEKIIDLNIEGILTISQGFREKNQKKFLYDY